MKSVPWHVVIYFALLETTVGLVQTRKNLLSLSLNTTLSRLGFFRKIAASAESPRIYFWNCLSLKIVPAGMSLYYINVAASPSINPEFTAVNMILVYKILDRTVRHVLVLCESVWTSNTERKRASLVGMSIKLIVSEVSCLSPAKLTSLSWLRLKLHTPAGIPVHYF